MRVFFHDIKINIQSLFSQVVGPLLVLDEPDLRGALAEALTADVDAVLAHQSVLITCDEIGFVCDG